MKSKLTKKPDLELERDDEDGVDVEVGGPAVAAAKKSKMLIIIASATLITIVLYFLFFKADKKSEKLEEVSVPKASSVARNEEGKSPFAIDDLEKTKEKENVDLFSKPETPAIPTLPDLPDNVMPQGQIALAPEQPLAPQIPTLTLPTVPNQPVQQLPTQNLPANQQQGQQQAVAPAQKNLDPRYSPIIVFSGVAEGTPSRGVGYENNIVDLNQDSIAQLQKTKTGVTATYITDRTHVIAQGKLLTAVLETAINTEVPGAVRAVVSRDVYGESGNNVLIPKGSRLFGSYSSQITRGQGRVQIGWTRLIRSDGVDLAISFNASDQFGRAGLSGDVDNKYNSIITNSILTSILTVGGVAAINGLFNSNNNTTTTVGTTGTTTTGNATNQAIADVSKTITSTIGQIISNAIDITPVIRVPQGTKITVIVNSDINIPSMSK